MSSDIDAPRSADLGASPPATGVVTFRFGPGALESVALMIWEIPEEQRRSRQSIVARAAGTYSVLCGGGWEHRVEIDAFTGLDPAETAGPLGQALAAAWTKRDRAAAEEAARLFVDQAFDEWVDPCTLDAKEEP